MKFFAAHTQYVRKHYVQQHISKNGTVENFIKSRVQLSTSDEVASIKQKNSCTVVLSITPCISIAVHARERTRVVPWFIKVDRIVQVKR